MKTELDHMLERLIPRNGSIVRKTREQLAASAGIPAKPSTSQEGRSSVTKLIRRKVDLAAL